jgi:hypothetical protein
LGLCGSSLIQVPITVPSGKLDEAALKDLIRAARALNLMGKSRINPR